MTNLEWLKENLTKEEKSKVQMCVVFNEKIYKNTCNGKDCYDCPLNKVGDLIDLLLQEHKEPIKLKQWEYDLIDTCYKCNSYLETDTLNSYNFFKSLKEKGHLRGIDDLKIRIEEILNNCEVIE